MSKLTAVEKFHVLARYTMLAQNPTKLYCFEY